MIQLVTEEKAAEMLDTPASTMRYWRLAHKSDAPPHIRLYGRIKYDVAVLEDWVRQHAVTSARASKEHDHGTVQTTR